MDQVITKKAVLNCDPETAFQLFTENAHLERWLTNKAEVEPVTGGKYELYWAPDDRENDSTIGCKVLAIEPNRFLCFEWKGNRRFAAVMNDVRPLTHVVVSFIPVGEQTEVHLLHTGWRDTPEWEEARNWFEQAWTFAFSSLQTYASGEAAQTCCNDRK